MRKKIKSKEARAAIKAAQEAYASLYRSSAIASGNADMAVHDFIHGKRAAVPVRLIHAAKKAAAERKAARAALDAILDAAV